MATEEPDATPADKVKAMKAATTDTTRASSPTSVTAHTATSVHRIFTVGTTLPARDIDTTRARELNDRIIDKTIELLPRGMPVVETREDLHSCARELSVPKDDPVTATTPRASSSDPHVRWSGDDTTRYAARIAALCGDGTASRGLHMPHLVEHMTPFPTTIETTDTTVAAHDEAQVLTGAAIVIIYIMDDSCEAMARQATKAEAIEDLRVILRWCARVFAVDTSEDPTEYDGADGSVVREPSPLVRPWGACAHEMLSLARRRLRTRADSGAAVLAGFAERFANAVTVWAGSFEADAPVLARGDTNTRHWCSERAAEASGASNSAVETCIVIGELATLTPAPPTRGLAAERYRTAVFKASVNLRLVNDLVSLSREKDKGLNGINLVSWLVKQGLASTDDEAKAMVAARASEAASQCRRALAQMVAAATDVGTAYRVAECLATVTDGLNVWQLEGTDRYERGIVTLRAGCEAACGGGAFL